MFPLSAINGTGTGDFLDAVVAALPDEPEVDEEDTAPRIAFLGRPNVGKSSLANKLLGRTRSIVTEVAGTTRDSVDARLTIGEGEDAREVVLVDTAGPAQEGPRSARTSSSTRRSGPSGRSRRATWPSS